MHVSDAYVCGILGGKSFKGMGESVKPQNIRIFEKW